MLSRACCIALATLAAGCAAPPRTALHADRLVVDRTFLSHLNEDSGYDEVCMHFDELRALLVMGDDQAARLVVRLIGHGHSDGAFTEDLSVLAPLAYENQHTFWATVATLTPGDRQSLLNFYDTLHEHGTILLDWSDARADAEGH